MNQIYILCMQIGTTLCLRKLMQSNKRFRISAHHEEYVQEKIYDIYGLKIYDLF
jgi:hypothetical protein